MIHLRRKPLTVLAFQFNINGIGSAYFSFDFSDTDASAKCLDRKHPNVRSTQPSHAHSFTQAVKEMSIFKH